MRLTFLGTGGAFSRVSVNYHNNLLIETDAGGKWLVDCGTTALESLDELGVNPLDLDGVLVTHMHADHIGGLEELGFRGLFLGPGKRFELHSTHALLCGRSGIGDGTELWENALKGGMMHIQDNQGHPVKADLETYFIPRARKLNRPGSQDPVEWFELREGGSTVETKAGEVPKGRGVWCRFVKTRHVPMKVSCGVVFRTESGQLVLFSGDTTSGLINQMDLDPFDLIFHDCMFSPHYPATVHTHFEELALMKKDLRERTRLMHYGDPAEAPKDLRGMKLARCHQTFDL